MIIIIKDCNINVNSKRKLDIITIKLIKNKLNLLLNILVYRNDCIEYEEITDDNIEEALNYG